MRAKAFPNILFLGTLWGTNLVVSRVGVGQFNPVLFSGLRLALASLGFGFILLVKRRPLSRDPSLWRRAALLGVVGTAVPMTVTMASLQYQSSGITALLVTTTPAVLVLMAHFFLPDERLNRFKGLGVILALAGAFLLILRGETGLPDMSQANPIGYILVLIGIFCESIMAIYVRKRMKGLNTMDVTGVRLLSAALVVMPISYWYGGFDLSGVNQIGVLVLMYATFVGALGGQLMAFYVTERFGATAFSQTAYIVPLVAAITGVVLLDELITTGMFGGMLLIVLGIAIINRKG